MHTRKDYMSKKCTFREFYGQFVDPSLRLSVGSIIGIDKIMNSTDESFNDIPLEKWDNLAPLVRSHCGHSIAKANGTSGISLSDCVCTAKEAAKQIKEYQSCAC